MEPYLSLTSTANFPRSNAGSRFEIMYSDTEILVIILSFVKFVNSLRRKWIQNFDYSMLF